MSTEEMLDFVKAMSDPDRLKIIGALSREPLTASKLSETLSLSLRELVDHLAFLEHVGIVLAHAAEKKQDEVYELDSAFLERLARQQFEGTRPGYTPAPNAEEETRRTLVKFLNRDGTIRQIPNSRSQPEKFRIILNYLISAFETGRNYTEKEVNIIIQRFNDDVAGLRRDLVDAGLLARERDGSKYWRPAPDEARPE
jgi:ArsR family transcriptional regulator